MTQQQPPTFAHVAFVVYGVAHPHGLVTQAYGDVTAEDATSITLHSDYFGTVVDRTIPKVDVLRRDSSTIPHAEVCEIAKAWGAQARAAAQKER
jgi:hypothetical protein